MPVQRLNHAVLYVRDVETSLAFYRDVLGFRVKVEIPGRAVFLQAEGSTNDHDLGLFAIGTQAGPSEAGGRTVGLYHLAWEVDTLADRRPTNTRRPSSSLSDRPTSSRAPSRTETSVEASAANTASAASAPAALARATRSAARSRAWSGVSIAAT